MTAVRVEPETFSSVDTAWLHMDTPSNLAIITGIIAFDQPPDFERLKATVERRLLTNRRFRQRVGPPAHTLGLPRWEWDPHFDLERHLQRIDLPHPAGHDSLQRFVGDLMSQPLEPDRPLWQFYYINSYEDGAALVCRIHHALADGLALVQTLLQMTDTDPDAPQPEPLDYEETSPGLLDRLLQPAIKAAATVGQTWRAAGTLAHEGIGTLIHPSRLVGAARTGASFSMALSKLLLIGPDRRTVLRGRCGIPKTAAWSDGYDLEDVKAIGRLMGGTVNDVLLSAMTGALRRYLEERGETVDGLNIRAVVPVNLRPAEDQELVGNHFGLVFLSLPVGIRDPLRRLVVLRRRMDDIKDSPEAVVALGILSAIGISPTQIENIIVSIFGMKGTAVVTNVPGPRQPLYFSGAKIRNLMFWVPTPGNLGLGISIVSYAGKVILGVATDAGLAPDPEAILQHFSNELAQLKRWGRPQTRTQPPPTPATQADTSATSPPISLETALQPAARQAGASSPLCQALTRSGQPCKNRALPGQATCRTHANLTEGEKLR